MTGDFGANKILSKKERHEREREMEKLVALFVGRQVNLALRDGSVIINVILESLNGKHILGYRAFPADKIRNGLIQHVSVGADYDALNVVDAKIPHGLSKPELSLVAVPGIPETNIQVLEHLRESLAYQNHGKVKLKVKEALGEAEVFCVFCSNPAEYFVSICKSCFDKLVLNTMHGRRAKYSFKQGVKILKEKEIDEITEKIVSEAKSKLLEA